MLTPSEKETLITNLIGGSAALSKGWLKRLLQNNTNWLFRS